MKLHFVYGSLMSPEVLKELLGRVPVLVPGTLTGYRRWRVPGEGAWGGEGGWKRRAFMLVEMSWKARFLCAS